MLGAIIGDVAGSFREFCLSKYPELPLLPDMNDIPMRKDESKQLKYGVTDDSILTIATADACLALVDDRQGFRSFADFYYAYGMKYRSPIGGFGGGFVRWLNGGDKQPYNSCGNGSAMRISPVAYVGKSIEDVLELAYFSASCTHNHPEGIKGAQATAMMIYYANKGMKLPEIITELEDAWLSYEPIEQFPHFDSVCPETMRIVMHVLLTTDNFHDAVYKAVTTPNGDSDTLGAIVGAIAEALYGIPQEYADKVLPMIPIEMKQVYDNFKAKFISVK